MLFRKFRNCFYKPPNMTYSLFFPRTLCIALVKLSYQSKPKEHNQRTKSRYLFRLLVLFLDKSLVISSSSSFMSDIWNSLILIVVVEVEGVRITSEVSFSRSLINVYLKRIVTIVVDNDYMMTQICPYKYTPPRCYFVASLL